MSLTAALLGYGLRQVIEVGAGAVADLAEGRFPGYQKHFKAVLEKTGDAGIAQVVAWVRSRLADPSQALPKALSRANDRSWQALAVALAGDGWIASIKIFFTASGDQKSFGEEVRGLLEKSSFPFEGTTTEFRKACLAELKQARKGGQLATDGLDVEEVAQQAVDFRRFTDPKGLIDGAHQAVAAVADALAPHCPNLAGLLRHPTPGGPPLLAAAFAYFFRREVETNGELARGLTFDSLRRLAASQEAVFGKVEQALAQMGERFEDALEILGSIQEGVLDLKAELERLGDLHLSNAGEIRSLLEKVLDRLDKLGNQKGEVRPKDSFSIRGEDERNAVKQLQECFRQLPVEQQKRLLALRNGLGKLLMGAGEFAEAGRTFAEVAETVKDASARAEASFNAYRAFLEERKWEKALAAIQQAAVLDRFRFAPFPLQRYRPQRILGAGAFGTAFLCHDDNFDEEVVVKALHASDLDRNLKEVFREAILLRQLSHPGIIAVRDCDFADPAGKARPFIVMEYFPGESLDGFLRGRGPLPSEQLVPVARQIAFAIQAAHRQGILHRDLKPDNVLVRKDGEGWLVKVIDFGLALAQQTIDTSKAGALAAPTRMGDSVAGTIQYAPPEQLGRLPGVKPGPFSDVYAFGKLCCYALFQTTEPRSRQLKNLSEKLRELLERCIDQDLEHRLPSFDPVLEVLEYLQKGSKLVSPRRPVKKPPPEPKADRWLLDLLKQILPWDGHSSAEEYEEHLMALLQVKEKAHAEARRLAEEENDYAGAVLVLEKVPERLQDGLFRASLCDKRDRVARLDEVIWQAVRENCVDGLCFLVTSLLELQPQRQDLRRLLDRLPWPKPGEIVTNSLGMKFAWIPPGTFLMGSPPEELERGDNETLHRVTLTRGFHFGATPVTQGQWRAVMGNNPSQFHGDDCPVERVSWKDCQEFCKKLGDRDSKRYRLPTESEWEYACRAGTITPFHFGNTISTDQANYDGNHTYGDGIKGKYRQQTTPVNSFPANAWGLYDMHGNVWEWCMDWYGLYGETDLKDPQGTNQGKGRVLRGGSWFRTPDRCRSAGRHEDAPAIRNYEYGCRICLCLD